MDKLTAMRTFVTVGEAGSFTAAARALGISKGAASQQVTRLEDALGVRLMQRTTRRLTLTEHGHSYLERARQLMGELEALEESLASGRSEPRGLLRLNAPVSYGVARLGPVLAGFCARHPGVELDVQLNDRRVDLIEENVDLAIRVGELHDSSFHAQRLGSARLHCCAAPAYLAAHGRPRTPRDLPAHRCLIFEYLSAPQVWPFEKDGEALEVRVGRQFRANNGDLLSTAAASGQGIVYQPDFVVERYLRDGSLLELFADWHTAELPVHALYPHRSHLSARVQALLAFLREHL